MQISSAVYISSSLDVLQCPKPDKPEYAFIGRSNVGKSSLINLITGQRKLARISSSPGKTQLINHFLINGQWYLADLPGYGYAKVSRSKRNDWIKLIRRYLSSRENLMCSFILIDARLDLQDNDRELINWMGEMHLPFTLAFTKVDKLSANRLDSNVRSFKEKLSATWEELPIIFTTSATKGTGRNEILMFIDETNRLFQ